MELRQMTRFMAVAETGSFSRAARMMGVAQSVLSREIRLLEEALGLQLLHRHGRGVDLTAEGVRYLDAIRPIVSGLEAARDKAREKPRTMAGHVSIGMGQTLISTIGGDVARSFRTAFPDVRLRLEHVDSLLGKLIGNQIDLAITSNAHRIPSLQAVKLLKADLFVMGREVDLAPFSADGATIDAARLNGLPLILVGNSYGLRQELDMVASLFDMELNVVVEISANDPIVHLANAGLGFTVLPFSDTVARKAARPLSVRRIVNPELFITFELAHTKFRTPTPAMKALEAIVRAELARAVAEDRLRGIVFGG